MKSVLLVEDDLRFARLLTAALGTVGLKTIVAPSASDAAIEMGLKECDVIILDRDLPDCDGIEWLTKLRASGNTSTVVVVSGKLTTTTEYESLWSKLAVTAVLNKPIEPTTLAKEIAKLLGVSDFDSIEFEMMELRNEYAKHLRTALPALHERLRGMSTAKNAMARLRHCIREAHTFAGTAGSYGFAKVAACLKSVEEILEECLTNLRLDNVTAAADLVAEAVCYCLMNDEPPACPVEHKRPLEGLRIVAVDDDPFFLKKLEYLLSAEGAIITGFTDSCALELSLPCAQPDLILLDLSMPDRNGLEICKALQRLNSWIPVPILIISGSAYPFMADALTMCGAAGSIQKGAKNQQLIDKVVSMVAQSKQRRAG